MIAKDGRARRARSINNRTASYCDSVDTAVAHLAAALGRPVWLLNRYDTCWRWLLDRTDSPWYPTLRQFRQPRPGDWNSVMREVGTALEGLVAGADDTVSGL